MDSDNKYSTTNKLGKTPVWAQGKYHFAETEFDSLMQKRIHKVLLICSTYDAFMLEEDGRIDEQIFMEYVSLNLRYPPQFIQVSSAEKAMEMLKTEKIDLVISMLSVGGQDAFSLAKSIKAIYTNTYIIVLTPFSREVSLTLKNEDLSAIDYVFSWLGHADILLAIIKLIEDRMNAPYDVSEVGVQCILLVENSVRYYSSYLPVLYKIIFNQSLEFMKEGLNEHQKMLRMRGRPKVLLARNYEEAIMLYDRYKENLLGVISDANFEIEGKPDKNAGLILFEKIKKENKYLPLLLQSSDIENRVKAKELKAGFIHKHVGSLLDDLKNFIIDYMGFGDLIFINPQTGNEIRRITNLNSLQRNLYNIPDDSFRYHLERHHLSKWLNARALFPIAMYLRQVSLDDFQDLNQTRKFLFETISNYRRNKSRGVIAKFYRDKFDEYLAFTRVGEGSLGGKARGLAFLDTLIKRHESLEEYEGITIAIPRTVVLSTDVFDQFMLENNLQKIALSDATDNEILQAFIKARLPEKIHKDLYTFLEHVHNPIAIRSSSLLEDSHYQPFAGIYSTYMIPKVEDVVIMVENLSKAIKSVYASVYYTDSKAYMAATQNVIDEEKMGVVLQEVCGQRYGDRFYPTISGVARSINFYPLENEKPEDGIVSIALGLGKHIVEGGLTLRFSPKYPKKILQVSTPQLAMRDTQKEFYALDLAAVSFDPSPDDSCNLLKLKIEEADTDGALKHIASTFDFQNNIMRHGTMYKGKRVLTFSGVLQHNLIPLAQILQDVLRIGQSEMNNPIEIEFAVNIDPFGVKPAIFNLLQIRPIVDNSETVEVDLKEIDPKDTIIYSFKSLGNGTIKHIHDIVYVKPEVFDASKTQLIAKSVDEINKEFIEQNKNYILVGPGRWGSSDPWLGIPVKWPHISAARVIVESGLHNYRIDPSQGTHFFQNLTSFRVGYLTLNPYINDGHYDIEYLNSQKAIFENEYIRHIYFEEPLKIMIDGQKNLGVVMKP